MPESELNNTQIYSVTYETLFSQLSPPMQKRVLAVKDNSDLKDLDVDIFVRSVIQVAEGVMDKRDKKAAAQDK